MPAPSVGTASATKAFSDDNRINSLLEGPVWGSGTSTGVITISYSFPFSDQAAYWSTASNGGYGPEGGADAPWAWVAWDMTPPCSKASAAVSRSARGSVDAVTTGTRMTGASTPSMSSWMNVDVWLAA